ncbi:hypothetical protein H6F93_32245 [Leptolyngbya sp. FACHB-671]|nr:hypothetical protein [Leptolyngbya sp. FACHB-671]
MMITLTAVCDSGRSPESVSYRLIQARLPDPTSTLSVSDTSLLSATS